MPAYLSGSQSLGLKALTLYPHNPARHTLPSIQSLVLLFDVANGAPLALMDGGYLTAMRTGAASGVATQLLARPHSGRLWCGCSGVPSSMGSMRCPLHRAYLDRQPQQRAR